MWLDSLSRAQLRVVLREVLEALPAALPLVLRHRPEQRAVDPQQQRRSFDMSRYRQRKVALQLQYEGGRYFGFAAQAPGDCEETVEKHLFSALQKVCLVQDRQSCGYSRCGRTDRGVSALGQVVALQLRSAFPKNLPNESIPVHPNDPYIDSSENNLGLETSHDLTTKGSVSKSKEVVELNYCQLMNRVLPPDIRVLGWSEVSEQFSARFSSTHRTYRYELLKHHPYVIKLVKVLLLASWTGHRGHATGGLSSRRAPRLPQPEQA